VIVDWSKPKTAATFKRAQRRSFDRRRPYAAPNLINKVIAMTAPLLRCAPPQHRDRLLQEARVFRPQLAARFVLNRCGARTVIARETAEALADHKPPVLAARVGQRVVFADAARTGRLVCEVPQGEVAMREITALAAEIERIAR
jgi:hypothetical protein